MHTPASRIVSRVFGRTAVSLAVLLGTFAPCLAGVSATAQTAAVTGAAPKALFISIIEGEGELNDVRARTAREPIVQVEDENHRPVAGALVLFSIDPSGGGAQRANFSGMRSYTTRTGPNGQAIAHGYQIAAKAGQVRILVHAVVAAAAADAVISQTNFAKGSRLTRSVSQHRTLLGAAAGAAAIAAVVTLETQGSGTTITAGTGTVRP